MKGSTFSKIIEIHKAVISANVPFDIVEIGDQSVRFKSITFRILVPEDEDE